MHPSPVSKTPGVERRRMIPFETGQETKRREARPPKAPHRRKGKRPVGGGALKARARTGKTAEVNEAWTDKKVQKRLAEKELIENLESMPDIHFHWTSKTNPFPECRPLPSRQMKPRAERRYVEAPLLLCVQFPSWPLPRHRKEAAVFHSCVWCVGLGPLCQLWISLASFHWRSQGRHFDFEACVASWGMLRSTPQWLLTHALQSSSFAGFAECLPLGLFLKKETVLAYSACTPFPSPLQLRPSHHFCPLQYPWILHFAPKKWRHPRSLARLSFSCVDAHWSLLLLAFACGSSADAKRKIVGTQDKAGVFYRGVFWWPEIRGHSRMYLWWSAQLQSRVFVTASAQQAPAHQMLQLDWGIVFRHHPERRGASLIEPRRLTIRFRLK